APTKWSDVPKSVVRVMIRLDMDRIVVNTRSRLRDRSNMQRYYFDHNATTPVSPEVLEAMLPVMTEMYGNASSIHHFGQMARQQLDQARRQVADLLGAEPSEIVLTSGGTEADNLAIFGAAAGG